MPRKITDVYELPYGLVARSNDGRLFFLKTGFGDDVFSADWKALPEISQEGYTVSSDDELEGTMNAVQKGVRQIVEEFTNSGLLGGGHHHHTHSDPHVPDSYKCPIDGCGFEADDVAVMTTHLTKSHAS